MEVLLYSELKVSERSKHGLIHIGNVVRINNGRYSDFNARFATTNIYKGRGAFKLIFNAPLPLMLYTL